MDKDTVWHILANIPVGTLFAWIAVIVVIITALCTGTIKLYQLFIKYKNAKDKANEQENLVNHLKTSFREIESSLRDIQSSLEEQKEVNLKQVRYTIVHTCEEALEKGEISTNKLRSLEEMYDEYVEIFHGNGYVKTLMMRVRKETKIVGKFDE